MQGIIQSAFLYGYMATQLLGGTLADQVGGKRVLAAGIAAFSLTSLLMPAALSAAVSRPCTMGCVVLLSPQGQG
jgi:ACS family sodium-dependent inorganic phosphate cotransporter/ACS family sodium-dependent inorganic phosphate cotransporter-like MFS transporter 9